jgi:type I restriction enzyme S subunit
METKEYRLTDICDFQGGTQPPKEEWINEPREGYVRMLQIRDFTQGKEEHIAYVKDTKKLNKCNADDILIGRYGASVGKILTGLSGAYNVAIIKTIPNRELLSKRYLYYVLSGTAFQNFITTIGARAAQAGFNKNDLSQFKLHIPVSLTDQEKIVAVLDRSNQLIENREKSIFLLDEFIKQTFLKRFGDPFENPHKIKSGVLEDVVKEEKNAIVDGPFGSSIKQSDYVENGIPIIRINNIRDDGFYNDDFKYITEEKYAELIRSKVEQNDILIARVGNTIGKSCLFDKTYKALLSTTGVAKATIDSNKANLLFVFFQMRLPQYQNYMFSLTEGGGQPYLNLTKIKNFKLILPPISEQNEFGEFIDSVNRIKSKYLESKQLLFNLFDSLCSKALEGKLDFIERTYLESTIKVEPKISGEVIAIDKINKKLEEFHKSQPNTGAPDEIDNKIRQLEAELKVRGEIPFWDEYVKYRIVKGKFKESFTFEKLWEEISKFPFESIPEYDSIATMIFNWLAEENAFIRQQFNESTKQIELVINETAQA